MLDMVAQEEFLSRCFPSWRIFREDLPENCQRNSAKASTKITLKLSLKTLNLLMSQSGQVTAGSRFGEMLDTVLHAQNEINARARRVAGEALGNVRKHLGNVAGLLGMSKKFPGSVLGYV